jgi:hypothetical protein
LKEPAGIAAVRGFSPSLPNPNLPSSASAYRWLSKAKAVETMSDNAKEYATGVRALLSASRADGGSIALQHALSPQQIEVLLAGGVISWLRRRVAEASPWLSTRGDRVVVL